MKTNISRLNMTQCSCQWHSRHAHSKECPFSKPRLVKCSNCSSTKEIISSHLTWHCGCVRKRKAEVALIGEKDVCRKCQCNILEHDIPNARKWTSISQLHLCGVCEAVEHQFENLRAYDQITPHCLDFVQSKNCENARCSKFHQLRQIPTDGFVREVVTSSFSTLLEAYNAVKPGSSQRLFKHWPALGEAVSQKECRRDHTCINRKRYGCKFRLALSIPSNGKGKAKAGSEWVLAIKGSHDPRCWYNVLFLPNR